MHIKVSAIVPVFNAEKFLRATMESLMGQTLRDIEIICVNDCSSDGSANILEGLKEGDCRISVINFEKNKGLSSARNAGLYAAKGDYVGFLDADDWFDADFCEKLYNAARRVEADIAVGVVKYWYSEADIRLGHVQKHMDKIKGDVIESVADRWTVLQTSVCWNKIYKLAFLRENNIRFPDGLYIEDVYFSFAAVITANRLVLANDTAVYYRQHSESIIANIKNTERPFHIFKIFEKCRSFLGKSGRFGDAKSANTLRLNDYEVCSIYKWWKSYPSSQNKERFYGLMLERFNAMKAAGLRLKRFKAHRRFAKVCGGGMPSALKSYFFCLIFTGGGKSK